nr:hypothetical protein [Bacillus dakarensis]
MVPVKKKINWNTEIKDSLKYLAIVIAVIGSFAIIANIAAEGNEKVKADVKAQEEVSVEEEARGRFQCFRVPHYGQSDQPSMKKIFGLTHNISKEPPAVIETQSFSSATAPPFSFQQD